MDGRSLIQPGGPPWVGTAVDWQRRYTTDEAKLDLTIALSRENVDRETGGPFGAAVFEIPSGALVAVGVNSVVRLRNSMCHAEMLALMTAQQRRDSFTLAPPGVPAHELVTSCEPCAMCLGATLWSGVSRLVFGARREDAEALGFDEGPVFPESHQYLRDRGIEIVGGVRRDEARAVLQLYLSRGGTIYNA
ncbi:MAG: nucleoside deaminase [Candidatus Rokubacteria bacterium]|nr:nucleoside deaminase [Candidatus Rokubacteria bacterium]